MKIITLYDLATLFGLSPLGEEIDPMFSIIPYPSDPLSLKALIIGCSSSPNMVQVLMCFSYSYGLVSSYLTIVPIRL